jgi:hypothetical protein
MNLPALSLPNVLAQLSADLVPPLVQWVVGASAAVFLLNQALDFYKTHMREQPSPPDTYATKKELAEAHGRMKREKAETDAKLSALHDEDIRLREKLDDEIAAIQQQLIANNTAAEVRVGKLNDKLDTVILGLGRVEGELHRK